MTRSARVIGRGEVTSISLSSGLWSGALESLSYFWPLSTHNPSLIKQKGVAILSCLLIILNGPATHAKSRMIQTLGSPLCLSSPGIQHHSSA